MRNEVMWAIRDAQGLTIFEKVFLYTVESRGTMKATWKRAADDMGMGKNTFYRTRTALVEKGLILTERMFNGVSSYEVNVDSLTGNGWLSDSLTENEDSLTGNQDSLRGETKKNIKNNKKKNTNTKKNKTKSADAPVEPKDEEPSFEEVVTPLLEDSRFSLQNTDSTEPADSTEPPEKKKHRKQIDKELNQAVHEQVLRDMYGDNDEKTECGW